jgi:orotidine-5'-phosphate decarboxylase
MKRNPLFCAVDTQDIEVARTLVGRLAGSLGGVKLGLEFFCANGTGGVRRVMQDSVLPLFLDLKLHDIPNTVAGALRAIIPLAPAFTTLHAGGGAAMMRAAVEAADGRGKILAVTLLTSLAQDDLPGLGIAGTVGDQVRRLADLAQKSGVDGLVCSAHEVAALRRQLGPDMILMVPGIRPKGADAGDQQRVMSPLEAMAAGADYLVVGRPITAAADPALAARDILASLEDGR